MAKSHTFSKPLLSSILSSTGLHIRFQLKLQLDHSALFSAQADAVDQKKHLVALQRVNESYQLQVIAGEVGFDFHPSHAHHFAFLHRVLNTSDLHSALRRYLTQIRGNGGVLRRPAVSIELVNLLASNGNLLVQAT